MFSESPCGLADSEIRTTIAPDSEIRRSKEARPPARRDSFDIRMANKRVVTPPAWKTKRPLWPPHGKQKGRYNPKIRMSRNDCKNRQFVPFLLIFVTRLLRNPAQIADSCAIFLHKTGLLCKILSVSFTFWAVR